ncbi:type IV toxin-antitoxin system AbiEi family antitoxin domain-containing protein [Janibacter melonis]|uniref:type IV toxin-antitoxin system AbiEi family antitoxin domain-containing protein n=1 Tax=Janibacter melonis TaxID=262209 RepID=UPI00209432C4|nr:type IV toxin-antitoxin system AbiEi family antitoxin domain-containing protein [Janibacter melonis]
MPGSRQDLRQQLQALAFAQAGYFSAAQARDVGYSYQAQKYHVDHGNWVRVDRALFRLVGWPGGADDTYARWSVWSEGRGVVSHESALAVHDLSDANPARVHLTVPRTFRKADGAVVLHPGDLQDDDVESRSGWRVTSPVRTLVDVADSDTPQETVDTAVADAIARGVTTPRRLLARANRATRAAARLSDALTAEQG